MKTLLLLLALTAKPDAGHEHVWGSAQDTHTNANLKVTPPCCMEMGELICVYCGKKEPARLECYGEQVCGHGVCACIKKAKAK